MNTELLYTILVTVGTIVFGFLSAYLKTKSTLKEKVNEGITTAEEIYRDSTKAGGEKFEWVINFLYEYIPSILKPIFTRDMISNIIQSAFDEIQKYATQQLDKLVNKVTNVKEETLDDSEGTIGESTSENEIKED